MSIRSATSRRSESPHTDRGAPAGYFHQSSDAETCGDDRAHLPHPSGDPCVTLRADHHAFIVTDEIPEPGSPQDGETGAVLVEMAIILPALVFFLVLVTQIGEVLLDYMIMSHIAGVGTRYAIGLEKLEASGPWESTFPVVPTTHPAQHQNIHRRVFRVAQLYGIEQRFAGLDLTVRTRYTAGPRCVVTGSTSSTTVVTCDPDKDVVWLQLEGMNYTGLFNWAVFNLRVTDQAGYLFE